MKAPFLRIEYTEKHRWHHIELAGAFCSRVPHPFAICAK